MQERGNFGPEEASAQRNTKDLYGGAEGGDSKKISRRRFLELAGAGLAGAVIGGSMSRKQSGRAVPAEPIAVSPPTYARPPENLPVEIFPSYPSRTEGISDEREQRGASIAQKKRHKNKKRENMPVKKKDKRNERDKKIEYFYGPIKYAMRAELEETARAIQDEKSRHSMLSLIGEICDFENKEIVRSRLGGNAGGKHAWAYFKHLLENSDKYARVFLEASQKYCVPVSVIMSVFSIEGAGRQASKNRFQMGVDTARAMGLRVDEHIGAAHAGILQIDERVHLEKSANAAARYLKKLYSAFGNQWGLAMSAYNAGAQGLANIICRHFKDVQYEKTARGPYFSAENLQAFGINSATLYSRERANLMRQGNKAQRFALRALWYPFGAEALAERGFEIIHFARKEQQKKLARADR